MRKIVCIVIVASIAAACILSCHNDWKWSAEGRMAVKVYLDSLSLTCNFPDSDICNLICDIDVSADSDYYKGMDEDSIVRASGFHPQMMNLYRNYVLKLKTYAHNLSLPLRNKLAAKDIEAIDEFEAIYDTVYINCISQEYYLRLMKECYSESVPAAFNELKVKLQ